MKTILSLILAVTMALFIHDGVLGGVALYLIPDNSQYQTTSNLPPFVLSENGMIGKDPKLSIIRIHDDKDAFRCSGTIISSKYILTAAHCLVDNKTLSSKKYLIKVLLANGTTTSIPAKAVAVNTKADYGLMLGDFKNLPTLKIALGSDSLAFKGQAITCGYPYGQTNNICYATDNNFRVFHFQRMVGGYVFPGMSGGPVFDTVSNMVMGVNSSVNAGFIVVSSLVGLFESLEVEVK